MTIAWMIALTLVLMWWGSRLSRDVIRALTDHLPGKDDLNNEYPVFKRSFVSAAYAVAVEASRVRHSENGAWFSLAENDAARAALEARTIPEAVAAQLDKLAEATVEAEQAWYWHSALMDANLGVRTGQQSREGALAIALEKNVFATRNTFGDARKLADEWKARLKDPKLGPMAEAPSRPYSNTWAESAHELRLLE